MTDFYAVIVLYNKSYKDSLTYKCLENNNDIKTIICDNSTKDFNNSDCVDDGNIYISMDGNKGLSKAYNAAVDKLKGKSGYMCIFDDDTQVPDNYFSLLDINVSSTHSDVYLPVVYDSKALMSPSVISGCYVRRAKDLDEVNDENITGINSAMAINLSVFDNYRYDEKLFLDYIDHAFLRDMKKLGKKISVAKDIVINQNFSSLDYTNYKGSMVRFNIYKKDFSYFCSENSKTRLFAFKSLSKRWFFLNTYVRFYKLLPKALKR